MGRTNVYTLDRHGGLLEAQERMVRKFADEMKDFDNIYYEICNEPYVRKLPDNVYRIEAWDFIIAGGGLFNHLDYSFAAGFEAGTFQYPETQPGGGGVAFRRQLRALRTFIRSFDFVRMKPADDLVRSGRSGQTSIRLSKSAVQPTYRRPVRRLRKT